MRCTIAPGFWMPDHTLPSLRAINFRNVADRYKLWAPHTARYFTPPDFKGCFAQIQGGNYRECLDWVNSLGMPIESELVLNSPGQVPSVVGALPNDNGAAVTFGQWAGKFSWETYYRDWVGLGGRLDYIVLDGPFNKMCKGGLYQNGFLNPMHCAIAVVFAMITLNDLFKQAGRRVQFVYLENLNWAGFGGLPAEYGTLGDLTAATTRLVQMARDCGVPFVEAQVDMPYTSLKVEKLRNFTNTCRGVYGMSDVAPIINSGTTAIDTKSPQPYNAKTATQNANDVRRFIDVVKGLKFSRAVAQTWQPDPAFVSGPLPAGHTLMSQALWIAQA